MRIRFLGACQEVGRSGVDIEVDGRHILLDYGVLVNHDLRFPVHASPRTLEAIVLSHAHLDHSGMAPLFYIAGRIPLYGVEPTFAFSDLLIRDMIKLSGYYLPYEYLDLRNMLENCVDVAYGQTVDVAGGKVSMLNAGHIPGSAQVFFEANGARVLYTGDINLTPTRLVPNADTAYRDVDAVVIESTYALKDHAERETMEEEFVSACLETVHNGGTVLVPAFGVGRSQEIMCLLTAHGFDGPVFVDGMALNAIEILRNHPSSLKDPQLFRKAVDRSDWIKSWSDRRRAVKTPGVIVSPAGMLKGGAAVFYMDEISRNRKNAVYLVSYQVPGSPGQILLDEGKYRSHGQFQKVNAEVRKFDFSSHGGMTQLHQVLSSVGKKARVFVVHGDRQNCVALAEWANHDLGLTGIAPKPGETFEI